MTRILLSFCLTMTFVAGALAAEDDRSLAIPILDDRPALDGALGEACWRKAAATSAFRVYRKLDNPSPARTEVKLFADDENLYVAFTCFDGGAAHARAKAPVGETAPGNDNVEALFDPGVGFPTLHQARLGWDGRALRAARLRGYDNGNRDLPLRAGAQTHRDRWTAEMAIPLSETWLLWRHLDRSATSSFKVFFARNFNIPGAGKDGRALRGAAVCCANAKGMQWSFFDTRFYRPAHFAGPKPAVSIESIEPTILKEPAPVTATVTGADRHGMLQWRWIDDEGKTLTQKAMEIAPGAGHERGRLRIAMETRPGRVGRFRRELSASLDGREIWRRPFVFDIDRPAAGPVDRAGRTAEPPADNVIFNPGFEIAGDKKPRFWKESDKAVLRGEYVAGWRVAKQAEFIAWADPSKTHDAVYAGERSLRLKSYGIGAQLHFASKPFKIDRSKLHKLSFMARGRGDICVRYYVKNDAGEWLGDYFQCPDMPLGPEWRRYTIDPIDFDVEIPTGWGGRPLKKGGTRPHRTQLILWPKDDAEAIVDNVFLRAVKRQ